MQISLLDGVSFAEESVPEDDVDRLFKKLQRREPPTNIVTQILRRIRQLPPEQIHQPPTTQEQTNASKDGE